MKALITGASGYIGSNLTKTLTSLGFEVHAIQNKSPVKKLPDPQIHSYDGNFESLDQIFRKNKIDIVFHLASFTFYNYKPEEIPKIIDSNIKFGIHLLEAMTQNNCKKLINTSTYWQHFDSAKYQPNSLYSATKQAFEDIIEYYVFDKNLSVISLEMFDVYGPNDNREKIFSLLEQSFKNKKPIEMTSGKQKMNMVYIDDAISAYLQAAQLIDSKSHQNSHKKYSVATKKSYTLKEVVEKYLKVSQRDIDIRWGKLAPRKKQIMKPFVGKILPKWQAKIELMEGLKKSYGKK
jgi:nucleoside-diphosphate-sugar epimerase